MSRRLLGTVLGLLLITLETSWVRGQEAKPVDRYGDRLPAHALARLGTVRFRQEALSQVLYCPDGKTLATVGEDDAVLLWDVVTGQRLRRMARHSSNIRCAAFSRDGKVLASADYDGKLLVSALATGKALQSYQLSTPATCLAFSPNGKHLACAGLGGGYQVWNLETGKLAHQGSAWPGHHLYCVEFSSDGGLLALGSSSDNILLLKTADWSVVQTLSGGGSRFRFAPDARHLLSFGTHSLTWWDVAAGKPVRRYKQDGFVYDVALHPNGKIAATGSTNGYFRVYSLQTGKLLAERVTPYTPQLYVFALAFSPDGRQLATANATLELWDTTQWQRLTRIDAPPSPANLIGLDQEGKHLVSLHNATTHFQVRRWDLATTEEIHCVERHNGGLFRHSLCGDGRWFVGWQGEANRPTTVRVWDFQTGKQRFALEVPHIVNELAVSPKNHQLVILCDHERFVFWDLVSGQKLRSFERNEAGIPAEVLTGAPGFPRNVYATALSSRADWLVGAEGNSAENTSIAIWNTTTGQREMYFGPRNNARRLLAFCPLGRSLVDGVSTAEDSWIDIWEPYTRTIRRRLPTIPELLQALAISPDGKHIAAGYANGSIHLWNVLTEKQVAHLEGHRGAITSLTFSSDSQTLGSASADTTILLWKLPSAAKVADPLEENALEQCWKDLSDTNARTAYTALLTLTEQRTQSLPFLERKMAAPAQQLERIPRWLADLASPSFPVRQRASQELAKLGSTIRPALNQARRTPASLEMQRRYEALLKKLDQQEMQPEELRLQRILETLQMIGTPAAQKLLTRFFAANPKSA